MSLGYPEMLQKAVEMPPVLISAQVRKEIKKGNERRDVDLWKQEPWESEKIRENKFSFV